MGKKRIVKTGEGSENAVNTVSASSKKRVESGTLYVQSTYNNTKVVLAERIQCRH